MVQYGLAFPYACSGFLRLLMPAAYHNDHVAEWVQQWIYFSFSFALLAVLSANAYRDQGRAAGWKLGMALAWLCMANNTIGWLWHGLYDGFDPITMTFGVVLFLALQFRYRPWFGTERMTPWLQTAVRRAGIFAGGIAALLVSLMTLSLILTGPLALDHEDARMHVKAVREALKDHYAEHGAWPASLDELPDDVDLTYRWKRVDYDPAEPSVSLEVRIPLNPPPLSWRLTFGRAGFVPHVSRIGGSFRPRDDTAAND